MKYGTAVTRTSIELTKYYGRIEYYGREQRLLAEDNVKRRPT